MADAAKHLPAGSLAADLRGLLSVLRTRKTKVFAYGFVVTFVACTIFIAFNPTSGSASPWFNSLFTSAAPIRSQFNSLVSYIFPNSSSTLGRLRGVGVLPSSSNSSSSPGAATGAGGVRAPPSPTNRARQGAASSRNQTSGGLETNQKGVLENSRKNNGGGSRQDSSPSTNQSGEGAAPKQKGAEMKNRARGDAAAPKKSTISEVPLAKDQGKATTNTTKDASSGKNRAKVETSASAATPAAAVKNSSTSASSLQKGPVDTAKAPNFSTSPRKGNASAVERPPAAASTVGKQEEKKWNIPRKGNASAVERPPAAASTVGKQEEKKWNIKSMLGCDIFHGRWVRDDSYPLYKEGSCPHIDESFDCYLNGRPDLYYQKLRWQPTGCNIPRLNPTDMLERLRGKRLVFVGDSLNRNMWESLVCILRNSIKDKSKVFEASGRHEFRTEGAYSFVFKDYNCSVEFFRSPFLVQEWEMPDTDGKKKETLRLDVIEKSSSRYKDADVIVFNTGHWWTHEKTSKGKGYYQEGNRVYGELKVIEAFHRALNTWAKWVDANVDPRRSLVFFRGYSASHFSGGQWNSGGQCDSETEPIKNETYLAAYPPKMNVLETVIQGMRTPVSYLNITGMTDYRKDAHPSVYRKRNLPEEERRSPERYQDCSHWCLPGVPDSWNELLYAQLLVRQHRNK